MSKYKVCVSWAVSAWIPVDAESKEEVGSIVENKALSFHKDWGYLQDSYQVDSVIKEKKMKIEGRIYIDGEFDSIEDFDKKYPGAMITAIDKINVIAYCEICDHPICENDDFDQYEDGVYMCNVCAGL